MAKRQNLLLLYDRPLEPAFVSKGSQNAAFLVPHSYLADKYKPIGTQLADKFGDEATETIPVKEIRLPHLGEILDLDRQAHFSLFMPKHRYIAGTLIDLFMEMRNLEELQSLAIYARDRVNPYLFNYALSVALLHRSDTQSLTIPSLVFSFPDKFFDSNVFTRAREEATIVEDELRQPLVIPMEFSGSDLGIEHRLAYFREDIGINLHHWHWHLVYPINAPLQIVNKNRRGELFYYMHQQIIARYNTERLCNKMARVSRFIDWRDPIKEGYFPKLNSNVANRTYPSRVEEEKLQNLARADEQIYADIDDLLLWRDRILDAIHSGSITDMQGNRVQLTEFEGIDVLGNIIESSVLSPNSGFYGDLHNYGHVFIALIHDPDNRHLESFGVMGDTATAMRDPVFYRWHSYINYLFDIHKSTLPRYQIAQVNYQGITVTDVSVQCTNTPINELRTFWQQSDIDISRGLDFQPRGPLLIRFTHLQHCNFTYTIRVNNQGAQRRGTCRIFLAPTYDERGYLWSFNDQRNMFIALDRFTVDLRPGQNIITRNSSASTVTIPWEQTFRNLDSRPIGGEQLQQYNFCGCGWPQHMLIPKGSPEGFSCQLFVMISNYADDQIVQDTQGLCNDADNYCGIKDKLYPDRRAMGYPFDRLPRRGVNTLQDFLTPNMRVQEVIIRFENRTFAPK